MPEHEQPMDESLIDPVKAGFWKTDKWRVIKEVIEKRCGRKCEYCLLRPMQTAHHRIDDRPGHSSYDNPNLLDLMAVCQECHELISGKLSPDDSKPSYAPNSIAARGDRGWTARTQEPGHWMIFEFIRPHLGSSASRGRTGSVSTLGESVRETRNNMSFCNQRGSVSVVSLAGNPITLETCSSFR